MKTPSKEPANHSSDVSNDSGHGNATSGSVSNSNHTDVDITTNSSGGTTTGSVTINGQTMPLPKSGSIHEDINSGNLSLELSQTSTSSGSDGSSQHTRVHSHTFVDSESF